LLPPETKTQDRLLGLNHKDNTVGIENLIEEGLGAFAADKALEAIDPNAGLLAKGAAAIAGFEGVGAIKEHFAEGEETKADDSAPADDSAQSDDGSAQDN
jgi:hypothetical protein